MKELDLYARLLEIDARLASAGFPRMSSFWTKTMKRWLRSGKRWLVGRVGRRGGKGIMSAKLAVLFALYCPIVNLTPGERAFVELLSVDREEASARLGMIVAAFKALGTACRPLGEEIQIDDRPVTIRVRAASIRAVGGTAILILLDEMARWRDVATGANPAREVEAAIKAELLSQPEGRGCMFSAPFGENDLHAERFDDGETDSQCVAHAATWEANPTISEAATRALESNPAIWEREYAARPSAHVTAIASKEEIAAVTTKGTSKRARIVGARYLGCMDPSGLKNDAWVCGAWSHSLRSGKDGAVEDVLVQASLLRMAPSFFRSLTFDGCIADALAFFREYGITEVRTDGHFFEAIRPRFAEAGIQLVATKQTSAAITQRVETLQARIANATIVLLDDEDQANELRHAQLVRHAGGRVTLRAPERRGAHDDTVSAILLAMDADAVVALPPAEGDIVIEHGEVHWDPLVGFEVDPTRYYTKLPNGALQEREPPYGSPAFVRWAKKMIGNGAWTPTINRWVREMGHEPRPGFDPSLLEPANGRGSLDAREQPAREVFAGVTDSEPEWLARAKAHARKR